jgi:hypothetical protein
MNERKKEIEREKARKKERERESEGERKKKKVRKKLTNKHAMKARRKKRNKAPKNISFSEKEIQTNNFIKNLFFNKYLSIRKETLHKLLNT